MKFHVAVLAALLATPCLAETPATAIEGSGWNGFYVGGSFGKGTVDGTDPTAFEGDLNRQVNVFAGYQWALRDDYVLGVELSHGQAELATGTDTKSDVTSLKFRAGFDVGRTLPYVVLGGTTLATDGGSDANGFSYGIGVDYALRPRLRLGAEMLQSDLDNDDATSTLGLTSYSLRATFEF